MNPYFEQTILNADPVGLIGMVYQRAVFCLREARQHLEHKRIAERSAAIMRAYKALEELLAALRPETAPELSGRLQNLYFHMQQRLLDANMQQADPPLAEVLGLLITLSEAWSALAVQLAPKDDVAAGREVTGRPGEVAGRPGEVAGRPGEVAGRMDTGRWRPADQVYESTARLAVQG
jgi:flagellar secretion chaperone FliS